jgi:ribosomal protein L5
MGLGEALANNKILESAVDQLGAITGQKPVITRSRKAIANFKLREGQAIGAMVTLRGDRMYEFLDRLINVALPRVRDFKGISPKAFDGRGNYTLGLREQIIFPEINYDQIEKVKGLNVSIVTSAGNDERALALAITASEHDGQARCVNLSPASLADSGFAGRLRALLWKSPRVARLIWLEIAEIAAFEQFDLVQELGRQLRSTGVHFGLEHAGERIGQMPRLFEAGLDYVKLDASIVSGVGSDEQRAVFVRSTVTLLHGMSIQVYAEGVADAADAAKLWECGLDGATGPWISSLEVVAG